MEPAIEQAVRKEGIPSACRVRAGKLKPSLTTGTGPLGTALRLPTGPGDTGVPHHRRSARARALGGGQRTTALPGAEASRRAQAAEHRRAGHRPAFEDHRGIVGRVHLAALRARRGANHLESSFDEWTEKVSAAHLAEALLDRLSHHVHILARNGGSHLLRHGGRQVSADHRLCTSAYWE